MGVPAEYAAGSGATIGILMDGVPYEIDPAEHRISGTNPGPWRQIAIPEAGLWRLTLIEGPQPPCPSNGWGATVI